MNKLQLTGRNLGRVFNCRRCCMYGVRLPCSTYQYDLTQSRKFGQNNFQVLSRQILLSQNVFATGSHFHASLMFEVRGSTRVGSSLACSCQTRVEVTDAQPYCHTKSITTVKVLLYMPTEKNYYLANIFSLNFGKKKLAKFFNKVYSNSYHLVHLKHSLMLSGLILTTAGQAPNLFL